MTGQRNKARVEKTDNSLPELKEREPAKDTFLISAGTYERILYGIEGRFVGKQLSLNPRFIFPAHIGCIKAISAGGRYLASGSTDEIIKLYDLKKRVELGSLHEHKGSITALRFHGHTHLLSASEDGAICIFRTKDWEPLKVLKGHKGTINDISIHPSGKLALSVAQDRTLILWNLLTGQRTSRTKLPQQGELVSWNKAGSLYTIAYAKEIQIYQIGQSEPIATIFMNQHITSMIFAKDNDKDYVVVGSQDKNIHIFNTDGTKVSSSLCHTNRIKDLSKIDMVFPDEKVHTLIVSVSSDGRIKVWDFADLLGVSGQSSEDDTASDNDGDTSDNNAATGGKKSNGAQTGNLEKTKDEKTLSLEPTPLAEYNADVRLTCVVASNDIY